MENKVEEISQKILQKEMENWIEKKKLEDQSKRSNIWIKALEKKRRKKMEKRSKYYKNFPELKDTMGSARR